MISSSNKPRGYLFFFNITKSESLLTRKLETLTLGNSLNKETFDFVKFRMPLCFLNFENKTS